MTRYAIGLGSNLGDRLGHLIAACREVGSGGGPPLISALYESAPVGGPEQAPFLNAVLVVESDLGPHEMLDRLNEIEARHDRTREIRWGPRTLDLDMVSSDGAAVADERLVIPHPRAFEREFVLRPLCDVWPEAPVGPGIIAGQALEIVGDQGVDLLAKEWLPPVSRWKTHALVATQFAIFIAVALAIAVDGTPPGSGMTAVRVAGSLLAVIGMILAIQASRRLGPALTAGPVPKIGAEMIRAGPYLLARHPIYGGIILVFSGASLVFASLIGWAVSVLLVPFFWLKSAYEERQLRMRFAEYREYREVVRRRLIPFVM